MKGVIVNSDLLEGIAFRHGLEIEADDDFEYVTFRGQLLRAPLGGAR